MINSCHHVISKYRLIICSMFMRLCVHIVVIFSLAAAIFGNRRCIMYVQMYVCKGVCKYITVIMVIF